MFVEMTLSYQVSMKCMHAGSLRTRSFRHFVRVTQFSVVIAALIHDVEHVGVPNFILMQENQNLALAYQVSMKCTHAGSLGSF